MNKTYGRKEVNRKASAKERHFRKRLIQLTAGITLVGIVIGVIGTNIVFNISSKKNEQVQAAEQDVLLYGAGSGIEAEPVLEWTSDVDGFIPLDVPMEDDLQEFIYTLAYAYQIDFPFVMGLIQQESSFRNIESVTNDFGLMQINKINHEWLSKKFGITDFLDPYQNTRSGMHILRTLFDKYEDPTKVLMCYNLGEIGAKRLWDKGITETSYSVKVLENTAEFTAELERMESND